MKKILTLFILLLSGISLSETGTEFTVTLPNVWQVSAKQVRITGGTIYLNTLGNSIRLAKVRPIAIRMPLGGYGQYTLFNVNGNPRIPGCIPSTMPNFYCEAYIGTPREYRYGVERFTYNTIFTEVPSIGSTTQTTYYGRNRALTFKCNLLDAMIQANEKKIVYAVNTGWNEERNAYVPKIASQTFSQDEIDILKLDIILTRLHQSNIYQCSIYLKNVRRSKR